MMYGFCFIKNIFMPLFWSGWLIEGMSVLQMCLIKYPAERQTSWLHWWKGVFRCVHKTQRRRLDAEDYNCVSPVRICCVTVSFSLLYSFRLRQESLSSTQGVYQECVWVHMSVYLYYYCIQWACNSWFPDLNKDCRESSISLYSSRSTLSLQHTHTKW